MVDLHSHILPGVDDGAKTPEDSLALLRAQLEGGVDRIALTPHFNAERTTVEAFCQKRAEAFGRLEAAVAEAGLQVELKLGAEVFFSSDLPELELDPLCLAGTPYLLVEFHPSFYPAWAKDIFYELQLRGITPLLAHIERYPYMLSDPRRLYELADAGVLLQVNAGSLLKGGSRAAMIQKLLRWDLVHCLATDTHSLEKRPPLLPQALRKAGDWGGEAAAERLVQTGEAVFDGLEPDLPEPQLPKKLFGRWF